MVEVGIDFRRGGNSVGKFALRTFVITFRFAAIGIFSVNSLWFLSLVVLTFLVLFLSASIFFEVEAYSDIGSSYLVGRSVSPMLAPVVYDSLGSPLLRWLFGSMSSSSLSC